MPPVVSLALSAWMPLAVAFFESVRVPGPTARTVVSAGMPVPEIASPTWKAPKVVEKAPKAVETEVTFGEPLVSVPLPEAVLGVSLNCPLVAETVPTFRRRSRTIHKEPRQHAHRQWKRFPVAPLGN